MMGPRQIIREASRQILFRAAQYQVTQEGSFPQSHPGKDNYLVALYPHGEHGNSLLIPQKENLTYMAAYDHFYRNPLQLLSLAVWLTAATIPVVREEGKQTPASYRRLLKDVKKSFSRGQKVAIYPQGTRSGVAQNADELALVFRQNTGVAHLSHILDAKIIPVGLVYPPEFQPSKAGPSGGKRIVSRLRGEPVDPVNIQVKVGEPLLPPKDKKILPEYMMFLSSLLWGMVHGEHSPSEEPSFAHEMIAELPES